MVITMITMMMECMQVECGMVQSDNNNSCDNGEGQCREVEYGIVQLDDNDGCDDGEGQCMQVEYGMVQLDGNDGCDDWEDQCREVEYGMVQLDNNDGCDDGEGECREVEYGIVDLDTEEVEEEDEDTNKQSTGTCCSFQCVDHFSPAELHQLLTLFQSKSQQDQQQLLLDQILLSGTCDGSFLEATFQVQGRIICRRAVCRILSISQAHLKRMYEMTVDGVRKVTKASRIRRKSIKYTHCVSWFDMYTKDFGEEMLHVQQIHLPVGHTKKSLYMMMKGTVHTYISYVCTCVQTWGMHNLVLLCLHLQG